MRLFGLIGYPLGQSFSKKYFDAKFEREGLSDCRFENFSIANIDEFGKILKENAGELCGMAITIPYKQQVLKFVTDISGIPQSLNACNCIRIRDGKLYGFNTDFIGFEKSLGPLLKPQHSKALVLGNGGVTEAVVYSLRRWGIPFSIVSRGLHKDSSFTYADINEAIIHDHPLIINTTPLGMFPNIETAPGIPYQFITKDHLLFDMVYNPAKTVFLAKGEERGATIKNGLEMLELQAEENWKIWIS